MPAAKRQLSVLLADPFMDAAEKSVMPWGVEFGSNALHVGSLPDATEAVAGGYPVGNERL